MQQSQAELTKDAEAKQAAFGMDRSAHKLRNTSRGLEFQNGIEDFDNTSVHNDDVFPSTDLILNYIIALLIHTFVRQAIDERV